MAQLLLIQQGLDHANVHALLQPMEDEAVAQCVGRDALADLGPIGGNVDGAVELAGAQRLHGIEAREESAAGLTGLAAERGHRHGNRANGPTGHDIPHCTSAATDSTRRRHLGWIARPGPTLRWFAKRS